MASIKLNENDFNLTYAYYNDIVWSTGGSIASGASAGIITSSGDVIDLNINNTYMLDNGNSIKVTSSSTSATLIIDMKRKDGSVYTRNIVINNTPDTPIRHIYIAQFSDKNFVEATCFISEEVNQLGRNSWFQISPQSEGYTLLLDGAKINNFPGPDSGEGGGNGNFDGTSDQIDFPDLSGSSAISTNMLTMYNPGIAELTKLSNYLWTSDLATNIAKLFQSPMEAIIDLSMINVDIASEATNNIMIGWIDTGIEAITVGNQYIVVNCGTLKIDPYWGSALDYNPYTTLEIYLPYIGIRKLDIDDCMDAILEVRYYVDLLTGTAVCMIKVTKEQLSSVLYNFSCNVSSHVPLSNLNMGQLINSVLNVTSSVALGVATGGASAMTNVAASTAMNVTGAKTHIEKGGRLDTVGGMLSEKNPYVIITRPVQSLATGYNTFKGYPSNITAILSTLSGYTEVEYIHMDGFSALENEKEEIERLLKSGVII